MPGRLTTKAISHIRLMELYRNRKKDLHIVFIYLEKAYDRVLRKVLWERLKEKKISMAYIRAI